MPKANCYYAVNKGREPGVYSTWDECEAQVKGFVGAKYKKFSIAAEAEAFAGINVDSSPQEQPQTPAKVTPPAKTTATRTSPYKRPEPARNLTPVSPTVTRATPSKRPSRVSSLSPNRSSPKKAAAKWNQRAASPDIADERTWDVAYTDGACRGNGKPGSVAGIGVWWGLDDPRNIAERCPGAQTNNRAELIAIVRLLETAPLSKRPLLIKTDSRYSMDCFKSWLPKWLKNGFTSAAGKPVKNAPVIRYLSGLLDDRARNGHTVRFQHIKGHAGHEGNEGADMLAGRGAEMPEVEERNWQELEMALGAKDIPRRRKEVVYISDDELEEYMAGLVDDDELERDLLDQYADGLISDEQMAREIAEG